MELSPEWGLTGVAATIVTAISGYIVLKTKLGHEQRVSAEGALIESGPKIIQALNATLASRDRRIDQLEKRNGELWNEIQKGAALNRDCEARCAQLTRRIDELAREIRGPST